MNVGCVWVGLKMDETRKRKYALARVNVDDLLDVERENCISTYKQMDIRRPEANPS